MDLCKYRAFVIWYETFELKEISLLEKEFDIVERALTLILAVPVPGVTLKFLHLSNEDKNNIILRVW